ncbi:MAG: putative regulator PutR for proline utilization, GntR family [Rhizobacter sp.]|nr:putative regulator PutR for proline utilization, GntR family [Rhizobacter sp.]
MGSKQGAIVDTAAYNEACSSLTVNRKKLFMVYLDKTSMRMGSLADATYMRLRELIESGELPSNSPLREVPLAEKLNVSRTPVREALRRLETEGLATFAPRVGLSVAALDRQRIVEIYTFLETLEGTAARYMAQNATLDELETLERLVERENTVLDDAAALSALNAKFHSMIYEGARNRYLLKTVLSIRDTIFMLGRTTLGNPGRAAQAHGEHLAIIEALKSRDADRAAHAMSHHTRSAMRERLKMLEHQESAR